jgi:hypothetical protein
MFVKSAALFTGTGDRNRPNVDVASYRLDLHSTRIQCDQSIERCAFDRLSSRLIAERSRRRIKEFIGLLCTHSLKLYIGLTFQRWRTSVDIYNTRRTILFKRYQPVWSHLAVPVMWCYRKGLQRLCGYCIFIYKKLIRSSFERWKVRARSERLELSRCFHRWDMRSSELKLARMNTRRFIYLMRNAVATVRVALMSSGLQQWRRSTDRERTQRHVRLLFRCWRTVVRAQVLRRRHAMLWVLRFLRHHKRVALGHFSCLHDTVVSLSSRCIQTSVWTRWKRRCEQSSAVRRALLLLLQAVYSRTLLVWRTNAVIGAPDALASPGKRLDPLCDLRPCPSCDLRPCPSSMELQQPRQAVSTKQRIRVRSLGVPSHVQPLYRDRQRQLLCDKAHTPADRLRQRWLQLQRSQALIDAEGTRSHSLHEARGRAEHLSYSQHLRTLPSCK